METKVCSRCNQEKTLSSFPVDRRHKVCVYAEVCLLCRHEKQRLYMRNYFKKRWKTESFRAAHKEVSLRSYHARKAAKKASAQSEASTASTVQSPNPTPAVLPFRDFKCSRSEPFFVQGKIDCLRWRFQNYLQTKFRNEILAHEYFERPFDPRDHDALTRFEAIQASTNAIIKKIEMDAQARAQTTQTPLSS